MPRLKIRKEVRKDVVWNRNHGGYGGGSRWVDGVGDEERQREDELRRNFFPENETKVVSPDGSPGASV